MTVGSTRLRTTAEIQPLPTGWGCHHSEPSHPKNRRDDIELQSSVNSSVSSFDGSSELIGTELIETGKQEFHFATNSIQGGLLRHAVRGSNVCSAHCIAFHLYR